MTKGYFIYPDQRSFDQGSGHIIITMTFNYQKRGLAVLLKFYLKVYQLFLCFCYYLKYECCKLPVL